MATKFLLGEAVEPAPGTPVLKRGEYADLLAAADLLAGAKKRAEEIVAGAEAAFEERRRAGYEAGLAAGREEMAARSLELAAASLDLLSGMEKKMVEVVMRALRTILGTFDRDDLAVQTIGHAMRLVREEKRIRLRVSEEQLGAVTARLEEMRARYPGIGLVEAVADSAMSPGGAVLETEVGEVDATLERQLTLIEETFRRHLEAGRR